jgi:hypothetical protein
MALLGMVRPRQLRSTDHYRCRAAYLTALFRNAHPQGNPLLDISAVVPSEFLGKYDVKPNDAVLAGAANGGTDKQLEVYAVRAST